MGDGFGVDENGNLTTPDWFSDVAKKAHAGLVKEYAFRRHLMPGNLKNIITDEELDVYEIALAKKRLGIEDEPEKVIELTGDFMDGTCSSCGSPLVWTPGRTYHPSETWDGICKASVPIAGTQDWSQPAYSFDVPMMYFIPN